MAPNDPIDAKMLITAYFGGHKPLDNNDYDAEFFLMTQYPV